MRKGHPVGSIISAMLVDLGVKVGEDNDGDDPDQRARRSRRASTSARMWCCATSVGTSARRRSSRVCGSPRRSSSPRSSRCSWRSRRSPSSTRTTVVGTWRSAAGCRSSLAAGKPMRTAEPGTPGVPAENQPPRAAGSASGGCDCGPAAMRWRRAGCSTGSALSSAPAPVELSGFGTHHRLDPRRPPLPGVRIRPAAAVFGDGARISSIGAQLYYGRVSGPTDNFTYWLFGLQLSYCPVGAFDLRGIRVLVAGGMSPDLPEPSGRPQEMRLLALVPAVQRFGCRRGTQRPRASSAAAGRSSRAPRPRVSGRTCACRLARCCSFARSSSSTRSDSGSGLLVAAEVFDLDDAAARSRSHRGRPRSGQVQRADRGRP